MNNPKAQEGVALIEALLAIVVIGIGVIGALGLQARALSALSDARSQIEATIAAEKLVNLIANDVSSNATNYSTGGAAQAQWAAELTAAIPTAVQNVRVTQQPPSIPGGSPGYLIDIDISWQRRSNDDVSRRSVRVLLEPGL